MEWFNGGVLNAISKCRQEKALFIVYICGKGVDSLNHTCMYNYRCHNISLVNQTFTPLF